MEIFGAKNINDSITLYFVQDTGSNSKEMRNAFTICQNAKLAPNLVGEDEVEELPTRMNCVFVLEEFRGKVFRFLASKDCLVVGPKCLITCINKRIPIPENQSPVFNLAMHGLVICASKLKRSKKEELATVVGYMGGSYSDQLTLAVTHLVADDGKSDKCMKANEHKIPIMCSSWVKAVWDASLNNDITAQDPELYTKHKLPLFKGLYITCSNLPQSTKLKLQKLIEGNGGVYMPALEQNKTTVLIIGDPVDGKKFQHAQLWSIPCVKPSWLHESVEKQYQVPYKEHIVTARPTCSTPTSDLPSFMSNDVSVVPLVNEVSNMEINETNTTINSVASFKALPSKIQKLTSQSNNDYKKHLEQLDMSEVNSAGLFLDGCKIYLSGFVSQEIDKLKKVLNTGGATIFGQLTDSVSHVIVGEFNANDAKAIAECSQRPHVVSVEWLLASIKCKGLAPVQQYLCLQSNGGKGPSECPPQLSSPLGSKGIELLKKPSDALENSMNGTTPVSTLKHTSRKLFVKAYRPNRTMNENSMMELKSNGDANKSPTIEGNGKDDINNKLSSEFQFQQSKNEKQVQKNSSKSNEGQLITARTKEPDKNNITGTSEMSTMNQGPYFQGLLFMVVGFEDPSPIIAPIEEVGGCVVNPAQFQGVADYAVVPLDGTPEKFSSMETVTVLWIEDCWEQAKVLPIEYYHQPLVMKGGCSPLQGVTLCITGFIGKERSYIGHVATSLGAVVQDSFSRKDHPDKGVLRSTHLVCKSPQGSKYAAAKKWGLPTVSKDWLSSCAATGIRQPEENYRPDLDGVTTNATTSADDHPAIKRLKTSSETGTSGADPSVIVEKTPLILNIKRPNIEFTKPSTSSSSVNIAKEAEMKKTIYTALYEDTMPQEQEKTNTEAEEFCSFQTPRTVKSKLQSSRSSLAPNESIVEEQRPDFLSTSDRKRLSCLSVGPSPGHVDTPDSPYGQVFTDGTPSPQTRKRWKKWIDNLPDLYSGSPVFSRKRRPSTPLNVLLNQLWVKFGGAKIDGIEPETGNLLPDGPFSVWAHEKSHQDIELQNGELVLKGTNISSADLSSDLVEMEGDKVVVDENEKPASSAIKEKDDESFTVKRRNLASSSECSQIRIGFRKQNQEQNQATPLRKETEKESKVNSDKSSDEEYSPTQQRGVMSERLASRILEAKKAASSGNDYEFVDKNVAQSLKRRSPEVPNNSVDWGWTVANDNAKTKNSENDSSQPSKRFSNENTKNSKSDKSNAKEGDLVEDETKEEEEEEEEEEESRPKERRVFVLSNIPNPRDKYESIIHNLGGEISSSANYDPQTTHLIIDKPVRSEKLLCCLASGKWVLHISYLTSCYQARTFLPEEDYEWGNERSRDRLPTLNFGSTEYHLAMSAYRWRIQRTEFGKVGVYSKFKAVLLTYEQKIPQYSRLLMAGGGTILDKSRIMEATHVFWDEDKVQLPVTKRKLKANNIYLLKPVYLGDYLMKSQPPNPLDYIIK